MELKTTWGDAAKAAGGRLVRGRPGDPLRAVCTDTRALGSGQAFWALSGERFDAHDFLGPELAQKADGWVVRAGKRLPEQLPGRVLEVKNTRKALAALAGWHRRRFRIPVVGITGSNGKTTVKEMLRAILALKGKVTANTANLNNEIGLPLSLLELTEESRFGVFEMGASRKGDIRYLGQIAGPTMGVLTNIGPAHLEYFGDLDSVLTAKCELLETLPNSAPVVLNRDDPRLARLLPKLGGRAVTFGCGDDALVRAVRPRAKHDLGGTRTPLPRPVGTSASITRESGIVLEILGKRIDVPGPYGSIHRINAAAAAAAATILGVDPEGIRKGLSAFQPAPLRFITRKHDSGAVLVVDAYNANPASMKAGIETFFETSSAEELILVLGDMKELGPESPRLHRELGEWVAKLPLAAVFLAGRDAAATANALRNVKNGLKVIHAEDAEDLADRLRERLQPGTAVYFKASRAVGLEKLVERL